MTKNILTILGHPDQSSFCGALMQSYIDGVNKTGTEGTEVKHLYLGKLSFNLILPKGFAELPELEPDLKKAQELMEWADHLVFFYPIWWYTAPALLKGFIERILIPGFAFDDEKPKKGGKKPFSVVKYWKGKTAHIIATMNAPPFYYRWKIGSPGHKFMKSTLKRCGVKSFRNTSIGSVKRSSKEKRQKWLIDMEREGKKA